MVGLFLIIAFIIILFVLFFVGIIIWSLIEDYFYEKEKKKERERRLTKIPLDERKCSNSCKYARNIKKYKKGTQEAIGAECTCYSSELINGFYVKGKGSGKFVWEENHIGCEEYDHPFASFL